MRILVNLSDNAIIQVDKAPSSVCNSQYVLGIPETASVAIDSTSYVQPVDGGDVASLAFADFLTQYPMYSFVVFNTLSTAADMADLDLTATFPTGPLISRAAIGRGSGPLPTGCAPNSVHILPQNNGASPARPGLLITDTIDISGAVPSGAQDFTVWWRLFDITTSEDVTSSYGGTAGDNDPSLRTVADGDPEPSGFDVFLSVDDGATYTATPYMTPTLFSAPGTLLRVAFRNTSTSRRYLAAFAIMF